MFSRIKKILIKTILILLAIFLFLYLVLWIFSFKKYPVEFGISFSPEYATYLELDWKKAYVEMLDELNPKHIRLAVPWNEVEKIEGEYDYSDIDFLMDQADKYETKVVLTIGQKVPRWPECFFPDWSKSLSKEEKKPLLFSYLENTVERYKNHPALEYWQVENEPFIEFDFGDCESFDVDIVPDEIELVRTADPYHKIIVTDSGELSLWYSASKAGDIFGSTLYRVVYSRHGFIWRYNYLPAGLYRIKARLFGNNFDNFFISELQAEPWYRDGSALSTPLSVQEETMNISDFQNTINYSKKVGASRVYFWGAEWWYWMKEKQNDSRYWDLGKQNLEL